MKIDTTYKARISEAISSDSKHAVTPADFRRACLETVDIYRKATDFFIKVILESWDEISAISGSNERLSCVEALTVTTKSRPDVPYPFKDGYFFKYPCYYRRAAIKDALGMVSSYKSNLANWEQDPVGKRPTLRSCGHAYPALYRNGSYKPNGEYTAEIKLRVHNTWDWVAVRLRKSDMDYINRHCSSREKLCPSLRRRGRIWSLDFVFEENVELTDTIDTVLSVDLGINNACTCCAMKPDGTILGREFLKLPKEQDSLVHALNRVKKAQQHGCYKTPRLWAKVKGINDHIAARTAQFIIDTAVYYNADVIVFEFLDTRGKKRSSKKQRLHHWKAKAVQSIVTDKAHRLHMRISHVCAWGTSKLAYDGSGSVERGIDGNYSICRFKNGKIYNCDLSASYNIGARYCIREIIKSLPAKTGLALEAKVPQAAKRSTCTYSTLISLVAELKELAPFADSESCTLAAA